MKRLNYVTLFLLFLFSIINCFGQSVDSTSYPVVYHTDSIVSNPVLVLPDRLAPELLKENIWIPDEDGGAMPLDIIHIVTPTQDKIYVYGKRRIVVFDGETYARIATIDISDHSQYFGILINYNELYSSENYFAYNEDDHLLYCTTENLELIAIDTETDSYSVIVQRPDNLINGYYYTSTFLKYDNLKDRLYWVIEQIISGSNFYVFNASDYSLIHSEEFEDKSIRDIEINNTINEYYLSIEKELRIYNADNYQITNTISNGSHYTGDLLYLNNGGLHKLFCFTYHGGSNSLVHVIDFNDGSSVSSFQQPSAIQSSCYYNPNTQFVYVGLEATNDLWVFNPGDYSTVANIDTHVDFTGIDGGVPLGMTSLSGKMIIGKEHEIVMVDESDNTVESIKQGFNNLFFRTIEANGKVFTIGANVGTVDAIKQDNNEMVLDQTLQIGTEAHLGCYNTIEHKAYFYTDHYIDNSNVYILNTSTNDITIVEIGSNISDMVFNENDNQVLVSTYSGTNQINVIDGVSDELLPPIQIIGQSHHIISMFLAPNYKLYCMVQRQNNTRIEVFDATNNYSHLESSNYYNKSKINGKFCYNPTDGNVYATIRELNPGSVFGKLVKIDGETNAFTDYPIGPKPNHIVCNPDENKVFVSHLYGSSQHYLTVFDCTNSSLSQLAIPGIDNVVFDLAYDPHNQFVYALHNISSGDGRVSIIQNDVIVSTLRVPNWSISLKYNTGNYNLYVYVPHNAAEDNEGELWEIQIIVNEDGTISDISTKVPLINKHADKFDGVYVNHDMLIDPAINRLFVANAAFSNISVIDIPEILVLDGQSNKNYKWLSFPRLERLNNDAVAVQTVLGGERIVPNDYRNQSELQYLMPGPLPQPLASNFYQNGEWEDNIPLDEIQSSLGYKLNLKYDDPYPDNNYLQLYGAVLDPAENVVVYEDNENWVGYWLYEEQSPFDAIPANVVDELTLIKTQEWVCVKEWIPANGTLIPQWVCAAHTGGPVLKYADMVVLESDANNDITFQWQNSGSTATATNRGEPVQYQYNEQADYTAYIIELDSTENPQEIAAFIGDSCVGASKVLASDTNVMVPGYIEGIEGEVVFEEYYGSEKSAKPPVASYFVNNSQSGSWERRTIHTSERKDHYLISFKSRKEENFTKNDISANIWPNPASGTLFYNVKAGTDALVSISVFDITGKLMAKPVNETMESGSLTGEFKLTDMQGNKLKPGIYLVEIYAGQIMETKKVIVK